MSIQDQANLRIRLREMMERHAQRSGMRLTYAQLSEMAGLSPSAVESMASRRDYNPTLKTLARLCVALDCTPGELLMLETDGEADALVCKNKK